MPVGVQIVVRGHNKFASEIRKRVTREKIINVVQHYGTEGQRHSQRIAPVDTGNLKRNIRYYNEDGGYTSRWTSEAEYALHQELGTRFQRGTPHIRPAFNYVKVQYLKDIGRVASGRG